MKTAPKGKVPSDLKIISVKKMTTEQHNALCSSCHAKVSPQTTVSPPGDRFFDHFDLVTLENPDYYPDGRDLGENYTCTTWLLSPCVKAGKLDCIKCHTSSGRYRFKDEAKANDACLPCHAERVAKAAEHIHHPPDKPGVPSEVRLLPHADDRLCPHEPERPLHAAPGPGRNPQVRLAQRLQPLP